MTEVLVSAFKRCGFNLAEQSVQDKLQGLLESLDVDPSWAAKHYEIFQTRGDQYSREVTLEHAEAFEDFARKEHRASARVTPAHLYGKENGSPANLQGSASKQRPKATPAKQVVKQQKQESAPPSTGFHARIQSGSVVSSLNAHLTFQEEKMEVDEPSRCSVTELGSPVGPSELFMVDSLPDRVAFINGRIMDFGREVEAAESCSLAHPVNQAAQEAQWMVGRICCDSEGRLNESSIMLEGSIECSQGERVALDVSKLQSYRLFSGQVVAVQGVNPTGKRVVAGRIITQLAPKASASTGPEAERQAGPLKVVVAAGPFSLPDNTEYEPLQALIAHCREAKPDLVLLLGPFVDSDQPKIRMGLVDQVYQDVFQEGVLEKLHAIDDGTQVVLVPSIRDMHHWPVFPQAPMEGVAPENVTMLGNPSTFRCGGLTWGVVTTDVLKHMSGQEIQKGIGGGDRLAGLASHILGQGSYYPMFPPALGTMLDSTRCATLKLPLTPDVLILPSDLNGFAKPIPTCSPEAKPTVCINPGRVSKGNSAGTFACFQIGSLASDTQGIDQSCKVNIIRI